MTVGVQTLSSVVSRGAVPHSVGQERSWRRFVWLLTIASLGPFLDLISGAPLNWLIGIAFLGWVAWSEGAHLLRWIGTPARKASVTAVAGGFLIIFGLYYAAQVVRPGVQHTNSALGFRSVLMVVAGYLITLRMCNRVRTADKVFEFSIILMRALVVLSVLESLYAVFQFAAGYDRLVAWRLAGDPSQFLQMQSNLNGGEAIFRSPGTFRRNEVLGTFLYFGLVATAMLFRAHRLSRSKTIVALAIISIGCIVTLSLTTLALVGIWCALLLFRGSRKSFGVALAVGVVAVFTVFLANRYLNGLIAIRFAEHRVDAGQNRGRVQMFRNWLAELSDRPAELQLIGTGVCKAADQDSLDRIGDIAAKVGIKLDAVQPCDWRREVHDNWYGTLSLEIGLVGMVIVWSIFAAIALLVMPSIRRQWRGSRRAYWFMLALSLLAVWPSGFVGAVLLYMPIAVYAGAFIALLDAAATVPSQWVHASST